MTEILDRYGLGAEPGSAQEWVAAPADLPVRVLAAVTDTVSDLDDIAWAGRPARVQLEMVGSIERLRSVLDAVELAVVAGIEDTGAAKTDGWAGTKDFVTAATGGPKGAGRRTLALAQALGSDRAETARHLGAGWISRAQAEVVVAAVDRLPGNPGLRAAAEALLLEQARDHDATDLTRLGRHLLDRLDPDGAEARDEKALEREERAAHHSRFLSLSEDGISGVKLTGRGTVEDAAWIKTMLLPLAAPRPGSEPGGCGGDSTRPAARCGIEDCAHDGRDPRQAGARMWDALIEAMRLLAGAEAAPQSHGAKPRVLVGIDYHALKTGLGEGAVLDLGGSLSAAAVRTLACDAEILPMMLGSKSQILDLGRSQRLVNLGLWLALIARDRHCTFPGCTRRPVACDAHHLVHWANGGPTSLDNLTLLCRTHHTVIHTTPWQVRINPDDHRPDFTPPPGRHRDHQPLRRRPLRE